MTTDWRERSVDLSDLIKKLHHGPPEVRDAFTDITFILDDNSEIRAHKLILALASPMFEAQFYGPLADKNQDTFEVTEVEAGTFRKMVTFVYSSGYIEGCESDNNEMYWSLLEAANFFLLEGLIDHCNNELKKFILTINSPEGQIHFINKASSLSIFNHLMGIGMDEFVTKLPQNIMEGFNKRPHRVSFDEFISTIENLSKPAKECLLKTYNGKTEATKQIEFAQNTRIRIENYFMKNGTKEQRRKTEAIREDFVATWFLNGINLNRENIQVIQSHFRKQHWKEIYENFLKDALPFLETNSGKWDEECEIVYLIFDSLVRRAITCPVLLNDWSPDYSTENLHCQHW